MKQLDSHFIFKGYDANLPLGYIRFYYQLIRGITTHHFTEELRFQPPSNSQVSRLNDGLMKNILISLHLVLGISYWKLTCAKHISINSYELTEAQAQFWNTVYTKGLGEFFYKNAIDFRGLVQFPHTGSKSIFPPAQHKSDRSLVLLGAGKDSIVTSELMKKHDKEYSLLTMNATEVHKEIANHIGKPLYDIKRILDKQLFELNVLPGIHNGHVPISTIYAFVGIFAAALYDFRYIISSNEESANYGNVTYLGEKINHQWSKSFEFESMLSHYVKTYITPDITYFSLLRPLTEAHIVKLFSAYKRYFGVFTSCNKNFTILSDRSIGWWCGECPKCAFVFLLLAAFLPKKEVVAILKKNLFSSKNLMATYKELLGVEGIKPFDCVGTPKESLFAFQSILKQGEYADDFIIKNLTSTIHALQKKSPSGAVFELSKHHLIPDKFSHILRSI
jgi:UDP-N-acetyl-alpha-D-muramoyl-L-alanyl-L-glutamate epimerase